jgi:streptomycin 6-kinase
VRIEQVDGTLLAFGRRGPQPVVVKLTNDVNADRALDAFGGAGVVRLLERVPGALLLERLVPGDPLSDLCRRGSDDEATAIIARTVTAMTPRSVPDGTPSACDLAPAFERYRASARQEVPADLARRAHDAWLGLCESGRDVRLLHGDLHHDNVRFDSTRGWIAIDPKGVVGEPAFEVGAALRNPIDMPGLFTDPGTIDRRVQRFARELRVDRRRVMGWAFAQAVLATIWLIEDDEPVDAEHPWLVLAGVLRQRLPDAA